MTSATPEPEGTAPSPDKSPPTREEGRPYTVKEPKPQRRPDQKSWWHRFAQELYADNSFTVSVLAVLLALIVGAVLMVLGNQEVRQQWAYFFYQPLTTLGSSWDFIAKAYSDMFKGAIVDPDKLNRAFWGMTPWPQALRPISETLTNAAPLILTGLAVAIPFRAGLFNIGGQGQAIMGAVGAGTIGILLDLPVYLNLPLALIVGILFGGVWGGLVGVLKAKTGAHEVITTIMLNNVAALFLGWYILQDWIKDPTRSDAISKPVHDSTLLPRFSDQNLRVNLAIVLALLVSWAMAWMLNRGRFGFELRAVGHNPHAASTAGMSVGVTVALTMALSGALAGLGGATMVLGTATVLTDGVVGQIGFNGILVALLGRVKPWGVFVAGLLFGALQSGGQAMQTFAGVSNELVTVIQAMIVIFVAAPLLVKAIFRLRKSPSEAASAVLAKG